jgi:hypothetical protein
MSVSINSIPTTIVDVKLNSRFEIYPVPGDGHLTITIYTQTEKTFDVYIFNNSGSKIYELTKVEVKGTIDLKVNISSAPAGVYYVVFADGKDQVSKKIIIR